jgi:hypothetical protein
MKHHGKTPRQSELHGLNSAELSAKQFYAHRAIDSTLPPAARGGFRMVVLIHALTSIHGPPRAIKYAGSPAFCDPDPSKFLPVRRNRRPDRPLCSADSPKKPVFRHVTATNNG